MRKKDKSLNSQNSVLNSWTEKYQQARILNRQSRKQRPFLFCILIQARWSQEQDPGNCRLDYTAKAAVTTAPLGTEARLFCTSELSRYKLEDKYSLRYLFTALFFLKKKRKKKQTLNANLPPSTVPSSHLSTLSLFQSCQVANLQMSTQMPFLICQQYVLRCPLLMGEDSNEMGFCEAKMSFSRTNEAGLTGLKVSSKDPNLEIQRICRSVPETTSAPQPPDWGPEDSLHPPSLHLIHLSQQSPARQCFQQES